MATSAAACCKFVGMRENRLTYLPHQVLSLLPRIKSLAKIQLEIIILQLFCAPITPYFTQGTSLPSHEVDAGWLCCKREDHTVAKDLREGTERSSRKLGSTKVCILILHQSTINVLIAYW